MSTPQTASAFPTKRVYVDDDNALMSFTWIRPMPHNGYLGEVTFRSVKKKPIQVFGAIDDNGSKNWGFQAQDGSFLCRMEVASDQNSITFLDLKKGNWPLITLNARFPGGQQG